MEVYESCRFATCGGIQGLPWLLLTFVQRLQLHCVGKCGVVERALCGGLQGGLYCLWKDIEIDNFSLFLGLGNLNTCKENEMSIELLIDFQFIRKMIRGIIVIIK
jgi:hypothetical protein